MVTDRVCPGATYHRSRVSDDHGGEMIEQEPTRVDATARVARYRLWLAGVAAVGIIVVAGTWFVDRLQNSTTPVTLTDLLEEMDQTPGQSLTRDGLPVPGVYRYATVGGEGIDALTKPSRIYPAETAVVVTNFGCGVKVEWKPLQERSEWWEMCIDGGGIAVASYGGTHEFFGNRDERTLVCPEMTWLVPPPGGPSEQAASCEGSGIRHDRVTRWSVSSATLADGTEMAGVGSTMEFATSGGARGNSTRTLVLTSRGLPLYWADSVAGQSDSVVGTVNHDETFTLVLVSPDPARSPRPESEASE